MSFNENAVKRRVQFRVAQCDSRLVELRRRRGGSLFCRRDRRGGRVDLGASRIQSRFASVVGWFGDAFLLPQRRDATEIRFRLRERCLCFHELRFGCGDARTRFIA